MQSLPYPNTLTDRELVRIADAHLLTNDSLPLDWQRVLIDRIADTLPAYRQPQLNGLVHPRYERG
jgi:hypothetical protein